MSLLVLLIRVVRFALQNDCRALAWSASTSVATARLKVSAKAKLSHS
jgi:hypothetical protein